MSLPNKMDGMIMIQINNTRFKCYRSFVSSYFPGLNTKNQNNNLKLKIEGGKEFYNLTKNILQGKDYQITNDNIKYLLDLTKKLKSPELQTKINLFYYKRECDENQIDQHPLIQFLVGLSTLIQKLSISNSEDISSQIIKSIVDTCSKKKKRKKNEDLSNLSPIISKKIICKLFYYAIINCLSSKFQSIDELRQHQQKIPLIIKILEKLDSKSKKQKNKEENDDNDTYINSFIDYVVKKFSQVESKNITINNLKQETFYLVYYLLSNKYVTISRLYDVESDNDLEDIDIPAYFLNFYPQEKIEKYFKDNPTLLEEIDDNKQKKRQKRKSTKLKGSLLDEKINIYLQNLDSKIKEGFPSNDKLFNIVLNDNVNELKGYFEGDDEKISKYVIPSSTIQYSCISALAKGSVYEMSAFLGSKKIFGFFCQKLLKENDRRIKNIVPYIVAGGDTKIIDVFIDFYKNQIVKEEDENESENESVNDITATTNSFNTNTKIMENESDNPSSLDTDEPLRFNDDLSNIHFKYGDDEEEEEEKNEQKDNIEIIYDDDDMPIKEDVSYIDTLMADKIRIMMKSCCERNSFDTYSYLASELSKYSKSFCPINYKLLDQFLKKCVSRGYFEFIPLLLSEGATGNTLLNLFCKGDNEIGISYFLQFSYVDLNSTYARKTPIDFCISNENPKMAFLILENDKMVLQNIVEKEKSEEKEKRTRKVITEPAKNAFLEACRFGLSTVVGYFLKKKIFDLNSVSHDMLNPLHLACLSGDFETFQEICKYKKMAFNPNVKVKSGQYKGQTPLHFACVSGNAEIVQLLLQHPKIDVNIEDENNMLPLQYAIENGNADVAKLLFNQEGINIDNETNEEETLLHLACKSNSEETVDAVLSNSNFTKSFDINAKTLSGKTAFQIALENQNCEIISLLLNFKGKTNQKKKKSSKNKDDIKVDTNTLTTKGLLPIIFACQIGRNDILDLLLENSKTDVNAKLKNGKTALFVACESDYPEIVEKLLQAKDIDVNLPLKDGTTPLIAACSLGFADIVELLLSAENIDVQAATKDGITPLIAACRKGNERVLELLINYKSNTNSNPKSKSRKPKGKQSLININTTTKKGKSALLVACENSRTNIINILLQFDGIDCNVSFQKGMTPLCYACQNSWENITIELIKHGADINYRTIDNKSVIYYACLGRNLNIIRYLLPKVDQSLLALSQYDNAKQIIIDQGTDDEDDEDYDNYDDYNEEEEGFIEEEERIVKVSYKYSNEPNSNSPLFFAAINGDFELFNLLINQLNNSDKLDYIDMRGRTLLYIACLGGNLDIIKTLVCQFGLDPNIADKKSRTPLHIACKDKKVEIVDFLINKSPIAVDINAKLNGKTPLEEACSNGSLEIVKLLLTKDDVIVNLPSTEEEEEENEEQKDFFAQLAEKEVKKNRLKKKKTNRKDKIEELPPLILACVNWDPEIIKCLIYNVPNLNVNVRNAYTGERPLHYACQEGNTEICELILSKSTRSVTKKTDKGKTPFQIAMDKRFPNVMRILIRYLSNEQLNSNIYNRNTVLIEACKNHYFEIVRDLLSNDEVDVNKTNAYNKSPLFIVAKNGDEKICELLLNHSQINIEQSVKQRTPLYTACKYGNYKVAYLLIKKGAEINSLTEKGKLPLHIACQHGFYKIVRLLLSLPNVEVNQLTIQPFNPNVPTTINTRTLFSPLHYSCYKDKYRNNKDSDSDSDDKDFYNNNKNNNYNDDDEVDSDENNFFATQINNDGNSDDNDGGSDDNDGYSDDNDGDGDNNYNDKNMESPSVNKKFCIEFLVNHPQIDINAQTSDHETALQLVLQYKDYDIIKVLLQHPQIDVNVKDSNGNTLLHNACYDFQLDIIKTLINNPRTDINAINHDGKTPFSIACDGNKMKIIELLLDRPDLNVSVSDQKSPIETVISNNNREIFKILIHHPSFQVNKPDCDSVTPLGYAICKQNIDYIHQLLLIEDININTKFKFKREDKYNYFSWGSRPSEPEISITPINAALKLDNFEIMKMLIQSPLLQVNEYQRGKTTLHSAIISNNNRLVSLLLTIPSIDANLITKLDTSLVTLNTNRGYNQSSNDSYLYGLSPLHIACMVHNAQIVEELLQKTDLLINEPTSADPSVLNDLKSTLYESYRIKEEADIEQKKKQMKNKPNNYNNYNNYNTSFNSFNFNFNNNYNNDDDLVVTPIEITKLSVEMNNQYKFKCNALYIACSENQPEIVSLLLKRNDIDVNAKSSDEQLTPLLCAVKKGYLKIVKLLLNDERCDPLITSSENTNILTYACQYSNIELLEIILAKCGNIFLNSQNEHGSTPLHIACQNDNQKIVSILLDIEGIDINAKDNKGDTPLHIVCRNDNTKIFNIILNKVLYSDKLSININAKNNMGEAPIHIAACSDVPHSLYKKYITVPNNLGNDEKQLICIDDYKEKTIFGILLNNGVDINILNNCNQTPLHYACSHNCVTNVEILLNFPNILVDGVDTSTPLMRMIASSLQSEFRYKISRNTDSNDNIYNNDFDSFHNNYGRNYNNLGSFNPKIIDLLVKKGANIQLIDKDGVSFLLYSIAKDSKEYVELCMNQIKDIDITLNYKSIYGYPIDIACDNVQSEIMQPLLQKKKIIKFTDYVKNKLIYEFVSNDATNLLFDLLIVNKEEENDPNLQFNVNYVDEDGDTPLHIAVKRRDLYATSLLANYSKTDVNARNKEGKTALHYACINSNSLVLSILTAIDVNQIKEFFNQNENKLKDYNFHGNYKDVLLDFLESQVSSKDSLNNRVDINLITKGITRDAYIKKKKDEILKRDPQTTYFNISYNEPSFNLGFTPLLISIACMNDLAVQKILLFPNVNVRSASQHCDTAISLASKNWNIQIIKMLLDFPGVDLNSVPNVGDDDEESSNDNNNSSYNNNYYHNNYGSNNDDDDYGLSNFEKEEIEKKKRKQNKPLLVSAINMNSIEIIQRLLKLCEHGTYDINSTTTYDKMSALHYICEDGKMDLLSLFVQFEKDVPNTIDWNIQNNNGLTPLHLAVINKHKEVVNILINDETVCPHIDMNIPATGKFESGRTAISFACEKKDTEIVALLLDEKMNNELDPFSFEANENKKSVRGSLCGAESKCDLTSKPNSGFDKGMSLLHYACRSGNADIVRLLLKHGEFNVNLRANGKSCLFLACKKNSTQIVELLLQQENIDVNGKTPTGITPLMLACQNGNKKIVEMIMKFPNVDVDALTVNGESALDFAENDLNIFRMVKRRSNA